MLTSSCDMRFLTVSLGSSTHSFPPVKLEIPMIPAADPTAFVKSLCGRKVASIASEIVVTVNVRSSCLINLTTLCHHEAWSC